MRKKLVLLFNFMVQLLNKGAIMKRKKILKENAICPICGQTILESEYDICKICYWENDDYQRENPNSRGGANNLSLNDYKIDWTFVSSIFGTMSKIACLIFGTSIFFPLFPWFRRSMTRRTASSFKQLLK